jgi:hypothetical protein
VRTSAGPTAVSGVHENAGAGLFVFLASIRTAQKEAVARRINCLKRGNQLFHFVWLLEAIWERQKIL